MLVTSRNPSWRQLATPVEVDVFIRDESIELLRRLAPAVSVVEADRIAEQVGDLPLAMAQAAGVLAETAMTAPEYLRELEVHAGSVMAEGKPARYPVPVAAVVQLSMDRLAAEDEAAAQLLRLCAHLAAEPIPVELFTAAPADELPQPLRSAARSTMAMRSILGRISRYGLARVTGTGPHLHRLTKAIILDQLAPGDRGTVSGQVERLLVAAEPGDSRDPENWPAWMLLLPHLLAVDPATSKNPALHRMAWEGTWYLLERGDLPTGSEIAEHLYRSWRVRLGPDDPATLHAAHNLASAYWRRGQHAHAAHLDRDTLARRRRRYGDDHVDTLLSAVQLSYTLCEMGRFEEAYRLNEDALHRLRKVHGENRRLTLGAAHNLAIMLEKLGRHDEALSLNEDTYIRRRRSLGEHHPHTLLSMLTMSESLYQVGRKEEATRLSEETLIRSRNILGPDHYTTLDATARNATMLHRTGRTRDALRLRQETLSRRIRALGQDHPHTIQSAHDLAESLRALGKTKNAQRIEAQYP